MRFHTISQQAIKFMKTFRLLLLLACSLTLLKSQAQITTNIQHAVSINESGLPPDSSAMLDINSSDKGLLLPTMTAAQRDLILNPAEGLLIYNSTDSCFNYYTGGEWVKDCGRSLNAHTRKLAGVKLNSDSGQMQDVISGEEGNYFVVGYFSRVLHVFDTMYDPFSSSSWAFLMNYDENGEVLWIRLGTSDGQNEAHAITLDGDGNIIVAGHFTNAFTLGDTTTNMVSQPRLFVSKFDQDGNFIWLIHDAEMASNYSKAHDVKTDADGNILVAGYFQGATTWGDSTISTTGFGSEAFLAKFSSDGDFHWLNHVSNLDNGSYDDVELEGVAVDGDGNVVTVGWFADSVFVGDTAMASNGYQGAVIAKFNTDGVLVWASVAGGTSNNKAMAVEVDHQNNIAVVGQFSNYAIIGDTTLIVNGDGDLFLVKLDPGGDLIWANVAGGSNTDRANAVTIDDQDNLYLSGNITGNIPGELIYMGDDTLTYMGGPDVCIVKYNPDGAITWARSGGGTYNEDSYAIDVSSQGVVSIVGIFETTAKFGNRTLQSSTFEPDGYFVQYNENGGLQIGDSRRSNARDLDRDPENELITNMALNGSHLEITEGPHTHSIDLANLPNSETDPQVGSNTLGYLSKWNGSALVSSSIYEQTTNRLGVGTTSPQAQFSLGGINQGSSGDTIQLHLAGALNMGTNLGSSNGTVKLLIEGYNNDGGNFVYPLFVKDENLQTDLFLKGRTSAGGLPHLFIAGNTSIGTETIANNYRLSVNGDIICNQISVAPMGGWPDYVFEPEYELRSLKELKDFIQAYKHLPGVPSAEEIQEHGLNLGDINKSLIEKVEELTLYILQREELLTQQEVQLAKELEERNQLNEVILKQEELIQELINRVTEIESAQKIQD
jgi:hypothetical protein